MYLLNRKEVIIISNEVKELLKKLEEQGFIVEKPRRTITRSSRTSDW